MKNRTVSPSTGILPETTLTVEHLRELIQMHWIRDETRRACIQGLPYIVDPTKTPDLENIDRDHMESLYLIIRKQSFRTEHVAPLGQR